MAGRIGRAVRVAVCVRPGAVLVDLLDAVGMVPDPRARRGAGHGVVAVLAIAVSPQPMVITTSEAAPDAGSTRWSPSSRTPVRTFFGCSPRS